MSERDGNGTEEIDQSVLQERYLKTLDKLEEGQLVDGIVVQITDDTIFVDVGYKSEGKIPSEEFDETPEIGVKVPVVLITKEGRGGQVVVSKRKADVKVFWKDLRVAFDNEAPVDGTFDLAIKGGFEIDLGYGVRAFCPMSKTDVVRVEDPAEYVGKKAQFLIDRLYGDNKIKIVLSRRAWLDKETRLKRASFFESTTIGDEVEGMVKSFTSFGAFIDLGGFDGLLHINDMSWGHVNRPKDYVAKNQQIKLKVIRMDPEEMKINLSLKHFSPDPWDSFEEKYREGDVVNGNVTKLTDFGAFIELEEGIEGLAHISELSWVRRIKHPREILNIGDEVETKILAYDLQQGRISLGLKQVLPNPWDSIDLQFPVGTHLTRPVRKITNTGAFIEVEEGIDGFLHVDDMSWTKRVRNPSSILTENEDIEVVVIEVDKASRRIRLGIKQLSDDPWQSFASSYPRGSVVDGEITSITDFGVFVRVQGEIEGLVGMQHILTPDAEEEDPDEALKKFKAGDKVKAIVTDIKPDKQRLSLSFREYHRNIQRAELSKYIHHDTDDSKVTFGDFLKEKESDSVDQ